MSNRPRHDESIAAFPGQQSQENQYHYGMTMRDYFAAQAMKGIVSGVKLEDFIEVGIYAPSIAKAAYEIAELMLRVRELTPNEREGFGK